MSTLRLKSSSKTGNATSPKPMNMFYIWYGELCRRANLTPLSNVKPAKPKHETVLDFVCDRIKAEEWLPIISALKQDTSLHVIAIRSRVDCKFLDDVDTEKKVKDMKRKGGYMHTHFILTALINAVCNIITRSKVLTYLELDGIPITNEFLTPLLEALSKNKSIKVLSFKHCPLRDEGCQSLCNSLRYLPNIEILNLTSCGLGSQSAQHIGKVIRHQQINRYCESWHCSLRYEDPDVALMKGLKRITLNNNPTIGDEGLTYILNELDDDLWIKAIDMQKCNITERMAKRLIDVIEFSKSLEIADFRHNDMLTDATMRRMLDALKEKQHFSYENEYEWCLTATSLPYEHSVHDTPSFSSTNLCSNVQKSKSAPFRDVANKARSATSMPVRRIKTCAVMPKTKSGVIKSNTKAANDGVVELTAQLQREIIKRMETERENKELQKKLETIQSATNNKAMETKNVKFDIISKANLPRTKESLNIKIPLSDDISKPLDIPMSPVEYNRKLKARKPEQKLVNKKNGNVEFVFTIDDNKEKNIAQSLFENLMYSSRDESDTDNEKDMMEFSDDNRQNDGDDEDSASNVSLLKFMETIKGNANYNALNCGQQNNRNWENNNKTSKVH